MAVQDAHRAAGRWREWRVSDDRRLRPTENGKGAFHLRLRENAASTLTPQGHEALAKVAAAFLAVDDRQVAMLLASGDVGEVACNGNEPV
jgi:hypothetical protein